MTYMQLCNAMQTGEIISLLDNGKAVAGRIIGIIPESGTSNIRNWIVTLLHHDDDAKLITSDVYVKTKG